MRLLILLFPVLLFSCSQGKGNMKLEVTRAFAFGGSSLAPVSGGGLMVWGKSDKGDSFAKSLEDSDSLDLNLNYGKWDFYVMAWDGTEDWNGTPTPDVPFGGKVLCGKSSNNEFSETSGGAVTLNVDYSICANDVVFKGSLATGALPSDQLRKLEVAFCDSVTAITSETHKCTDDLADGLYKARKAPVSSYRVVLKNQETKGEVRTILPGGIFSECVTMLGAGSPPNTEMNGRSDIKIANMPAGAPGVPFAITLELYADDACDINLSRAVTRIELPNGATSNLNSKVFADSTQFHHVQFIPVTGPQICQGRGSVDDALTSHPFAGGDGSELNPYLICNYPQWAAINSDSSFMTAHYKLQMNLNFNPYSAGLTSQTLVTEPCMDLGSNFIPIGYRTAACNASTPPQLILGAADPFLGSLRGAGFKLENFRLRAENNSSIGLFAKLGLDASIKDLKLVNGEVTGLFKVGGLVGNADGASGSTIKFEKISAVNLRVGSKAEQSNNSGIADVGGLVGKAAFSSFSDVKMSRIRVKGNTSQIGGLAGSLDSTFAEKIAVESNIDADSNSSVSTEIGGVVGTMATTTLDQVKHEGSVIGSGKMMGGIVGKVYSNSDLTNFYSISYVESNESGDDVKIGGAVGLWDSSTSTVGPGYVLGKVRSGCSGTACLRGGVVGHVLTAPGTINLIKRLNDTQSGHNAAYTTQAEITFGDASLGIAGFTSGLTTNFPSPNYVAATWVLVEGQYPRLGFEQHPCLVAYTGNGKPGSPFTICNYFDYSSVAAGNSSSDNNFALQTHIRIPEGITTQFDITTFNGKLTGNGKAFIGGSADSSSLASPLKAQTAHIGTLNGVLKDVSYLGIARVSGNLDSDRTGRSALLVRQNNGIMEKVSVHGHGIFPSYGAGIVANNSASGALKNVKFRGSLNGNDGLAGIAVRNEGLISKARFNGSLVCATDDTSDPTCREFTGIAYENSGTIQKTTMSGRIYDQSSNATSYFAPFAIINTPSGVIIDSLVSKYSSFELLGNNHSFFVVDNQTIVDGDSGSLIRLLNNSMTVSKDITTATAAMTGWPSTKYGPGKSAADQGSFVNIVRRGRSGKILLSGAPYTCTNSSTVNISSWGSSTAASTNGWDTYITSTINYNSLGSAGKKLVLELDYNGQSKIVQVLNYAGSNNFVITAGKCTNPGQAYLYWTKDIPVAPDGYSLLAGSEIVTPQFAASKAVYGSTWSKLIWKDTVDSAAIMNFYKFFMGITTVQEVPATWEIWEDQLALFKEEPDEDDE